MLAETAELVAELNLKGDFTRMASKAQMSLRNLDKRTEKLQTGFRKMGQGAAKALGTIAKGVGVGAVVGGVAFKWAADFEEQLNTINTVAGVTPERLDAIGDSIKVLAEQTGTGLGDLTSAYYDLVSAGVDAADAQDILTQANTLAIGGLSSTQEAVDLLTTAINAYGADAADARKITDGFAQAIAAGKVTASQLAASFAQVAPFAADLGVEIEELQAGYALLTAKGIPAAQAATYMRAAIMALQKPTAALAALQADLNVDFEKMARDRGLVYAYNELQKAAEEAGIPMQKLTGRIEGAAFATNTAGRNFRKYNKELDAVRRSSDGAGVAAGQMAERQKGVNAALRRLRETARVTGITLAEGLLPGAAKGFDSLGKAIRSRRREIANFGTAIGRVADQFFSSSFVQGEDQGSMVRKESPFERMLKGIGTAFDSIKQLPWDDIKANFSFVTGVASKAVEIFKNMPPELQTALITLLAANKLTGGLVASGLKDIASFALKSLTTIMAGNVTVIGKGITTPGAPGSGGGKGTGGSPGLIIGGGAAIALSVDELHQMAQDRLTALHERLGTQTERLNIGNRIAEQVRGAAQTIREKAAQGVGMDGRQNDLLRDIAADAQAEVNTSRTSQRAASAAARVAAQQRRQQEQAARMTAAKTALVQNAVLRTIPVIGTVRSAANATAQAIRQKDLSVRVGVNLSTVTVAQGVTRATTSNRVIIS